MARYSRLAPLRRHRHFCLGFIKAPPLGALSDTAIRLSHGAAALGYRHAGCLQLSHVRTAHPSADGRGYAASRTAISGRHVSPVAAPWAISETPEAPTKYLASEIWSLHSRSVPVGCSCKWLIVSPSVSETVEIVDRERFRFMFKLIKIFSAVYFKYAPL